MLVTVRKYRNCIHFGLTLMVLVFAACTPGGNYKMPDKKVTVGIAQLGEVSTTVCDTIYKAIQDIYGFRVLLLSKQEIPQQFFVNIKSPRFRADSIIRFLKNKTNDSLQFIVGITGFDISTTKYDENGNILKPENKYTDWGVFGLGYMPGPSCIVSTYRLKTPDKKLFYNRVKKVVVHELGHNLGLDHCPDKQCVMTDAVEKISTIDNEPLQLCDKCSDKVN
jgi:archaemetzincin